MVKKVLLVFVLVLVLASFVSAQSTEITVKTLPFQDVTLTISVADSVSYTVVDRLKQKSDYFGEAKFETATNNNFNLVVYLKSFEENLRFDNEYEPGESVYIEAVPEGYTLLDTPEIQEQEEVVNETQEVIEESEEIVEEAEKNSEESIITGFSISESGIFYG